MPHRLGTPLLLSILFCGAAAGQDLKAETLDRLKLATAFITVEGAQAEFWGTGFLFLKRGTTAYILTCEHVVGGAASVKVVFNSGQASERTLVGKVIATDPEMDLACVILKDAKDLPAALDVATTTTVRETETVFAAGFPFGKMLAAGKKNPEITISKASVSSIRKNAAGRVIAVQMSGDVNPGHSGGPVIDAKGKVVGVTQSKVSGTETAFAVPGEEIAAFLKGSVKAGYAKQSAGSATASKYEIAVEVADPLAKLKSVSVAWCLRSAARDAKPAADGSWSKVNPTMKVAALKLVEDIASATIEFSRAAGEPETVEYTLQITFTYQDGKTVWMEPAPLAVRFAAPSAAPPPAPPKTPGSEPGLPPPPETPAEKGGPVTLSDDLPVLARRAARTVISEIFLSKDGAVLYALDVTECKLYKLGADKLQPIAELSMPENAFGMCMSPDGKTILVATRDPVWPATTNDRAVSLWTNVATATFTVAATFKLDLMPWDFEVTDSGLLVVSTVASGDRLILADVNKKTVIDAVRTVNHTSYVHLHSDQSRVYLGDTFTSPPDFRCVGLRKVKDRQSGQEGYPAYDSKYHGEHPLGGDFAISPDARYLVSFHGGVVKLGGNNRDNDLLSVGKVSPASSVAFCRGTTTFLLSTMDGQLQAYDLPAWQPKKTVKLGSRLSSMIFDAGRKRLYAVASAPRKEQGYPSEDPFVAGDIVVYSLAGK